MKTPFQLFPKWAVVLTVMSACAVQEGILDTQSDSGSLTLRENSGLAAELYLDGIPTGRKTPTTLMDIPAGSHIVSWKLNGYTTRHDTVVVAPQSQKEIIQSLKPSSGSVRLDVASAWTDAQVQVDGLWLGRVPLSLSDLTPGVHHIVVRDGNAVAETTLTLQGGAVQAVLSPKIQNWSLVEHFSNVACLPCPTVDRALERFLDSLNNPRAVHIAMHVNSPTPEDPFYLPFASVIDQRIGADYYSVLSVPRVLLNGSKTGSRQDSINIPKYLRDSLPAHWSAQPLFNLSLRDLKRTANRIEGKIHTLALSPRTGLRLRVALVEKEIHMAQAPGINLMKDFRNIFRGFATLESEPTAWTAQEIKSSAFAIDHNLAGKDLRIVAWIEDPNQRIILQTYAQDLSLITTQEQP